MWNFGRGEYVAYRNKLEGTNYGECCDHNNIDCMALHWTDTFLNIARESIPYKMVIVYSVIA